MAKSLYGAYRAAGRAGGAYRASLQDIQNVGYEQEYSAKMYEMDAKSRQDTLGAITEGISLASNLYGGWKSKKEFGEAQTEVQTGMAKTAYGKSDVGKAKGAKKWSELDEEGKSKWMGKFTPTDKPQAWHEKLFGVDKEVRFGEKVEDKEGKDLSEYYSKSDILAKGTLSKATRLGKESGTEDKSPSDFNLDKEVGGIGDEEIGGDKSGISKWEERRKNMNIPEMGSQWPGGSKQQTTDYVTPDGGGEGYGETQGFGSNFLGQSNQEFGPSSQMQKMMGIYKGKPKGGWNPSEEDWYQEEFAEGLGWKGGRWQ